MDEMFSKILVTGSSGMVGSYVDFGIKTDQRIMDVTDLKEVLTVSGKHNPKIILHLAAETDVDRCERDPEHAYAVNSVGTYNIAAVARTSGAKLIYVSTAGVFDGKKEGFYGEEDTPNPQNYYGHSKFLGELAVKNLKDYLIVRACWMMGGGPKKDQKFVAKIISQIRDPNVKEIKVVTDQYGSPTYAKDLVAAIKVLVSQGKTGIFHLANKGSVSRYDVAKFIMDYFKTSKKLIASDLASFGLDGKRAKNEALDSKVDLMRPWQEALGDYLKTEWSN